jgi:hypothetical protein
MLLENSKAMNGKFTSTQYTTYRQKIPVEFVF